MPTSISAKESLRLKKRTGYLAAIAAPIICFYAILAHYFVNLPFGDDYETALPFMARFANMNWLHRLGLIFQFQHNEYKLMFENAILALQYVVFGRPNFIALCLAGDLLILALFFGIWTCLMPKLDLDQKLMTAVPIVFLLFELRYAETLNWATPALQNIGVLVFALFCVSSLTQSHYRTACLFFALSIASSGNGFLLFPIGVWLMARRRSWTPLAAWIAVFVVMVAIYSIHYTIYTPTGSPSAPVDLIRRLNPLYSLSFMGSLIGLQWAMSAAVGAALLLVFLLMMRKRYDRVNPAVFYFAIFLMLTAIAVSSIRSSLGLSQSFTGRYRIYSVLLMICSYIFAMEIGKRWYRPALIASVLICVMGDVYGHYFYKRRTAEIWLDASVYAQNLCDDNAYCLKRHDALVEGRNIYRLPANVPGR
jgi:uncharacterized membrane protein YjfL (UPF0719 family)